MLTAVCRYGPRVVEDTRAIVEGCRARGELVSGPEIRRFEDAFAARVGSAHAISASYGRMAFYYILQALNLPPGGEVILPALTFWVIPEMVRVAGLTPVFADVDSTTFTIDPRALERAVTERTVAVVPTHLYGLPCDMDPIMEIAARRKLAVVEDCAHALGARYGGRQAGTFGDAAFFSLQTVKPLNTYGGGMAVTSNAVLARRVRELAEAEPWPAVERVQKRVKLAAVQRFFSYPVVFTMTAFPALWVASFYRARPDVYLWEKIRPLSPLPGGYRERYTNVQAALGLAGIERLDEWNAATQAHARLLDEALAEIPGVCTPVVPDGSEHVYYQYCVYVPDRDELVRRALRRGIDVETLHVDVCPSMGLFGPPRSAPGAERASQVVQLPVYASLSGRAARAIGARMRSLLTPPEAAVPVPHARPE